MFKIILWSNYFEHTLVWTMVWNSYGQFSGTCLIRGHFGLELAWSEAVLSALWAHNDPRAHSPLIRGHFGPGRSDQRSHLSGTVWSEAISSATSTWAVLCWTKEKPLQIPENCPGNIALQDFSRQCNSSAVVRRSLFYQRSIRLEHYDLGLIKDRISYLPR